jgi:hypothetical protein
LIIYTSLVLTKLDVGLKSVFMNAKEQFTDGDFVKSSKCTYPPGGCVEVAIKGNSVAVRDAKNPSQILSFTRAEWDAFVQGVKAGEFDAR